MDTPSSPEQRALPCFKVQDFEGPLDLLLFLIKKNEINLYDIPIAQITEQYLEYLRCAIAFDLEDISEFQVMAASLVYLKSRMLLPVEVDMEEDMEDPRQGLVDRLIEYQKFKKLSQLMEEKERETEWCIERKRAPRVLPLSEEELWQQLDIWDLLKTFSSLMTNLSGERIIDLYEEVSVNEKITLMSELLEQRGECSFTDLVIRNNSLMDKVCAFLAILEAVKIRLVVIVQHALFGDIRIRPSTHATEEAAAQGGFSGERDGAD
ncbi:MAG: segregation/condensation protein A [Treponema sp.]|jgi:segregation and condensation protein A|nr:segregation/condensation protein A [Treponema sp.]